MPPDGRTSQGSIAKSEAIPGKRNSQSDDSSRRRPSRRGVDLDKPEGFTGSNSRFDRKLVMKYSPDRDPRRMDLPKYPTYWLGSDSPPLLRIHWRPKSNVEPLLKGRYPRTRAGSRKEAIPRRTSGSSDRINPGMFSGNGGSRRRRSQPVRKQFQRGVSSRHG
jgi:hypothetical protein